jgi:hypothetical protein
MEGHCLLRNRRFQVPKNLEMTFPTPPDHLRLPMGKGFAAQRIRFNASSCQPHAHRLTRGQYCRKKSPRDKPPEVAELRDYHSLNSPFSRAFRSRCPLHSKRESRHHVNGCKTLRSRWHSRLRLARRNYSSRSVCHCGSKTSRAKWRQFVVRIRGVNVFVAVAGELHSYFRRHPGVRQCGNKALGGRGDHCCKSNSSVTFSF